MTTGYNKPLPRPVSPELTKPFWEAAQRHELVMPRCKKCDHFFFDPREECPRC
ncbi:MAG: zinc ribbon domain-containing protein, partial [Stenotrophomonas maltophilia]